MRGRRERDGEQQGNAPDRSLHRLAPVELCSRAALRSRGCCWARVRAQKHDRPARQRAGRRRAYARKPARSFKENGAGSSARARAAARAPAEARSGRWCSGRASARPRRSPGAGSPRRRECTPRRAAPRAGSPVRRPRSRLDDQLVHLDAGTRRGTRPSTSSPRPTISPDICPSRRARPRKVIRPSNWVPGRAGSPPPPGWRAPRSSAPPFEDRPAQAIEVFGAVVVDHERPRSEPPSMLTRVMRWPSSCAIR